MAAIVNQRDVILQSSDTRVANITVASNLIVNQQQVTGTGLQLDGAKWVTLSASSQVFQIPKTGAITPSTITLSVGIKNLTNTPVFSIIAGTVNPLPTLVNGVSTVSASQLLTPSATIRVSVIQDGKTYYDDVTLIKADESSSSIVGFLTSESSYVSADYLGNVVSYYGVAGTFKVYQGSSDITTACSFSVPSGGNPQGLTYTLNPVTGAYDVLGGFPSNLDVATLTIRATFGATTVDKVLTLNKAVTPTANRFLKLSATSQVFKIDATGANTPSSITFSVSSNGLSGSPSFYCTPNTATITYSPGQSTATITFEGMGSNDTVKVTASQDGLEDYVTVTKLREGRDAITAFLTNESSTVATDSSGNGGDFSLSGGTFKVYDGLIDKTTNSGIVYSVVSSSGVTISIGASTGIYTVSSMSSDSGTATLRAVYGSFSIEKVYSIAKSKEGKQGLDYDVVIESDKGTVFKPGQTTSIVLSARVYLNGVEVTANIPAQRFRWKRYSYYPQQPPNDDATWNLQFASGYKQITITTTSVESRASFVCEINDS